MPLDTHVFLLIVIGGVILVWSFRRTRGEGKEIKEIEYLAFACCWGILLVGVYAPLAKWADIEALTKLLANPLASGLFFSILGLLVGTVCGTLDRRFLLSKRGVDLLRFVEKKMFD